MKQIRLILVALTMLLAFGTAGTATAQAGTGHFSTNLGDCDFTFMSSAPSSDSHSGWDEFRTLTGTFPGTFPGFYCDTTSFVVNFHVHQDYTGNAEVIGTFTVPGILDPCSFSGTLTGTGSSTGFTLGASPQTFVRTAGTLCPSTVDIKHPTDLSF
ncbi:MAG: hypothetical protein J0H98_05585 [Solirubrobacterales bacterium]|nr:hypothetical protein [Solirubrobacterales bacterium]